MLDFEVGLTGPDHEPTIEMKWYAQIVLTRYDVIKVGLKTFAFGPTPEKAMSNLSPKQTTISPLSGAFLCLK